MITNYITVPQMKLRLMGLRCTHIVSTKKPDARAFFGLQPLKPEDETSQRPGKRKADGIDQTDEDYDLLNPEAQAGDIEGQSPLDSAPGDANTTTTDVEPAEPLWDCPICGRPQPADERRFNDHLDSCLSRQTIRDAVQRDTTDSPPLPSEPPVAKRVKTAAGGEKKRGRSAGLDDPRQKKLFFG